MVSFPPITISADPLSLITILITSVLSVVAILIFFRIGKIEASTAETKQRIANGELEFQKKELMFKSNELEYKKLALHQVEDNTEEISNKIATKLINDPSWLDRFMEKTGATYGGSVFGHRINHFYYEKQKIAELTVSYLDDMLMKNSQMNYCFLIDSGTTLYHLFFEICERIRDAGFYERWKNHVCIVTNNLPGIQYFMKNCKNNPSDEYSEIIIPCYLLPGKPLSVYGAVTGDEACDWLEKKHSNDSLKDKILKGNNNCELQQSKLEKYLNDMWKDRKNYRIISLMSANYIVRESRAGHTDSFYPVARGEGHTKIKYRFSEVADSIFILSPLMKFSFSTVDELNDENDLKYGEFEPEPEPLRIFKRIDDANIVPSKVKYTLVRIEKDDEKCTFFTTERAPDNLFYMFGDVPTHKLKESYNDRVVTAICDVSKWIPKNCQNENFYELQLKAEIPHRVLRDKYKSKKIGTEKEKNPYIWDTSWIELSKKNHHQFDEK